MMPPKIAAGNKRLTRYMNNDNHPRWSHHSAKFAVSPRCSKKFRGVPVSPRRKAHPYGRCVQNPLYPHSRFCLYLVPDAEWEDRSALGLGRRRAWAAGPADSDFRVIELPRVLSSRRVERIGFRYIKRACVIVRLRPRVRRRHSPDDASARKGCLTGSSHVRGRGHDRIGFWCAALPPAEFG